MIIKMEFFMSDYIRISVKIIYIWYVHGKFIAAMAENANVHKQI